MARLTHKTTTRSTSETECLLEAEANRIAKEAHRQCALEWLLQGSKPMTDAERDAVLAEIDGRRRPKKRRR